MGSLEACESDSDDLFALNSANAAETGDDSDTDDMKMVINSNPSLFSGPDAANKKRLRSEELNESSGDDDLMFLRELNNLVHKRAHMDTAITDVHTVCDDDGVFISPKPACNALDKYILNLRLVLHTDNTIVESSAAATVHELKMQVTDTFLDAFQEIFNMVGWQQETSMFIVLKSEMKKLAHLDAFQSEIERLRETHDLFDDPDISMNYGVVLGDMTPFQLGMSGMGCVHVYHHPLADHTAQAAMIRAQESEPILFNTRNNDESCEEEPIDANMIQLKISVARDEILSVRISPGDPIKKIYDYVQREKFPRPPKARGKQIAAFYLSFDGEKLAPNTVIRDLDLMDEDMLDVVRIGTPTKK